MASCRILNFRSTHSLFLLLTLTLVAGILVSSCGTTQETTREPSDQPESPGTTDESSAAISDELILQINSNRSSLDDVFTTRDSDMPSVFRQQSTARDIGDPNEGYRVQILSTRDVNYADSVANDFRFWADENFNSYRPKAYVLFRQPYYKVHIGNFQFHDHAMKLNQYLKQKYPDAWVVHDEVEPNLVPPDTTTYGKQ